MVSPPPSSPASDAFPALRQALCSGAAGHPAGVACLAATLMMPVVVVMMPVGPATDFRVIEYCAGAKDESHEATGGYNQKCIPRGAGTCPREHILAGQGRYGRK
jgi:hypothetical protein